MDATEDTHDSLVELDAEDCRTLLQRGVVGRIAYWPADGPRVHPVNYAVLDDAVLVRTLPGSALARLARTDAGVLVAFGVDAVDHDHHRGWSVQARGPLDELTDPAVLAGMERLRPPRTWAPGERTTVVRVRCEELTGRRLGAGWDAVRAPAYRRLG